MRRGGALVCLVLCTSALVMGASARADDDPVVIRGMGTAHGLGMAMDGVEGQARAGWTHDRILDLFYPGTATGHAGGTISVGLAEGAEQRFVLPGGGTVTGGAEGLPLKVARGASITVVVDNGRPVVRAQGQSAPPTPSPTSGESTERSLLAVAGPGNPLESPPPAPPILTPLPSPTPEPNPTPPPAAERGGEGPGAGQSVRIVPLGEPALVRVEATGRQYRGVMEVRPANGTLRVVNLVDLETYVAGIAEEKGAGWPLEGLKTLAVAARSLGAATMTWYGKNRANGYDICPTQNCQVYLGYDGEEPLMRRAVAETAGKIRVYKGTPILAMYHGNGGGQTESYHRVARTRSSPHPYLTSIRYPYADPKRWRREESLAGIGAALAGHGVSPPSPIERIEILERGDSPRVIRMRLHGNGDHSDLSGTTFMEALDLWSTWFEIGDRRTLYPLGPGGMPVSSLEGASGDPGDARSSGFLVVLAAAVAALATAVTLQATSPRLPLSLRVAWPRLRAEPVPSPPGP